jgi:hypothetical protein
VTTTATASTADNIEPVEKNTHETSNATKRQEKTHKKFQIVTRIVVIPPTMAMMTPAIALMTALIAPPIAENIDP